MMMKFQEKSFLLLLLIDRQHRKAQKISSLARFFLCLPLRRALKPKGIYWMLRETMREEILRYLIGKRLEPRKTVIA